MVATRAGGGIGGGGGGPRSISRCYAEGYFAWRGRAISCVREMWQEFESAPPSSLNFLQRGRSTSYTTSRPLLQGCRNEKRQHPTGNCIDAAPPLASKSISFYSFEEGTAIIAQLPLSLSLTRLASWDERVSRQRVSNEKAKLLIYIYICFIL